MSFALTQFSWEPNDGASVVRSAAPTEDIQNVADKTGLDQEVVEAIVKERDATSGATWSKPPALNDATKELVLALDLAVREDDADAWAEAADMFLADLSEEEMNRVLSTLGVLGENQMSSAQRDEAGIAQPGSR